VTDSILLANTIKSKGIKYCFLAETLKMSYQALRNKMTNKSEFLPSEIEKICELLGISDDLQMKNNIFNFLRQLQLADFLLPHGLSLPSRPWKALFPSFLVPSHDTCTSSQR